MANYPDRCQHLKINGTQCGSPALRRNRFCFFHKRYQNEQIKLNTERKRHAATFVLPVLEDANSVQVALMQVMRLLVSQQIDHKTASLLLYALQTASTNLRMTKFDPNRKEVVLDPRDAANTAFDSHLWDDDDFEDEEEVDEDDPVEIEAQRAAEAVREKARKAAQYKEWLARHPQYAAPKEPAKVAPSAQPAPVPKKPVANMTKEELQADIHSIVKKNFFPGMPESILPDQGKEKKAT